MNLPEERAYRLDLGSGFVTLVDSLQSMFVRNMVEVSPYEIHSCIRHSLLEGLHYVDFSSGTTAMRSSATNILADVLSAVEMMWMNTRTEVVNMELDKSLVQRAAWSIGCGFSKLAEVAKPYSVVATPRHIFLDDSYNELIVYF